MKTEDKEIWKPVTGYESIYLISDLGNLVSLDRRVLTKGGKSKLQKGCIKKCSVSNGYKLAMLSKNGKEKGISLHKLVALHFVPNLENKPIINHIDGDKLNNCASNLEWCTQKENIAHSHRLGLQNPVRGDNHHYSKITEHDVRDMRYAYYKGVTAKEITSCYDISYSNVCRILKGKTWKHVEIEVKTIPFIGRKLIYMLNNFTFNKGLAIDKSKVKY